MASTVHSEEISQGERFEFGRNWSRFLTVLNEQRIELAEASLRQMLQIENLDGKRFLDIGSGSGLFSLAARRLGAKVYSLDYDPYSVACTKELRHRYFPNDADWTVSEGSVLDTEYIKTLGLYDVVYSWGVLHHTGDMWKALDNASLPVAAGGKLFVAIYNDMGSQSSRWKWIKRTYNRLPAFLRPSFAALAIAPSEIKPALTSLLLLRPGAYIRTWTEYENNRGMTKWRDIIDWVGGYPYEVAKPEEIFDFYVSRGFSLTKLKCGGVGLGCSEFVFVRNA